MIAIDNIILALIGLSMLIGLYRGFFPEVLSIVSWVAAFWVAWQFSPLLEYRLEEYVSSPALNLWASRALLFVGVRLVGGLITELISVAVDKTGLTGTTRVLGMMFGFARGVLIFGVLVMFADVLQLTREPWWGESALVPYGEKVAEIIRSSLPEAIGERLPGESAQAGQAEQEQDI